MTASRMPHVVRYHQAYILPRDAGIRRHLDENPPSLPPYNYICTVPSRGGKNISELSLALDSSIGNGLLAPCKHKWLEAWNLGLSSLGALNMHLVNFQWM